MKKTMTATISISTNPATAHIGRYFIDVRDTTRPTQDPAGRQMTTRVTADPAEFLAELSAAAETHEVELTVIDDSGETWEPSLTQ